MHIAFSYNSPSSKIYLICSLILDLLVWYNSHNCTYVSQTVSSSNLTYILICLFFVWYMRISFPTIFEFSFLFSTFQPSLYRSINCLLISLTDPNCLSNMISHKFKHLSAICLSIVLLELTVSSYKEIINFEISSSIGVIPCHKISCCFW